MTDDDGRRTEGDHNSSPWTFAQVSSKMFIAYAVNYGSDQLLYITLTQLCEMYTSCIMPKIRHWKHMLWVLIKTNLMFLVPWGILFLLCLIKLFTVRSLNIKGPWISSGWQGRQRSGYTNVQPDQSLRWNPSHPKLRINTKCMVWNIANRSHDWSLFYLFVFCCCCFVLNCFLLFFFFFVLYFFQFVLSFRMITFADNIVCIYIVVHVKQLLVAMEFVRKQDGLVS